MSFIVQIIDAALPGDAVQRNRLIDKFIDDEDDKRSGPSEALGRLYQQLVLKYPCISSFKDSELDECVWGDGPLIHNFGHKIAVLNISQDEDKVVADILKLAGVLNLKVVDTQSGAVYYPNSSEATEFINAIESQQQPEEQLTKAKVLNKLVTKLKPILTPLGFVWSKKELRFNKDVSYGKQYFDLGIEKRRHGGFRIYFSFRLAIDAVIKLGSEITGKDCSQFSLPFFDDFFTGTYRDFIAENEAELDALLTELTFLTSEKIVPFLEKLSDLKSIYSTLDHEDKYKRIPIQFSESLFTLTYLVCPELVKNVTSIYLRQCIQGGPDSLKINDFVNKLSVHTSKAL